MQIGDNLTAVRQRQTWQSIHDVAATETLDHGPDRVTVAAIAKKAGISPRTFFNYFASKEDAIVGISAPCLSDEIFDAFTNDTEQSPLLRVTQLTAAVAGGMLGDTANLQRRHEIVTRYPDLRARLTYGTVRSRELLVRELIEEAEVMWRGAQGLPLDPNEARALIMMGSTVVSFTWQLHRERMHFDTVALLQESIDIMTRAWEASR